ncbi:MAG: diguanylate cyclase [Lachnospiraceae bacterium]|nr:diguanylate cyclase [Lachnospiraceae bacterium]
MKRREYFYPAVTFLVFVILFSSIFFLVEKKITEENQERHLYIASSQANLMKNSVDTAIARVYTFSALIRDNSGSTDFFDKEGKIIYNEIILDSGIPLKNVAIAPNGVVEKVYPQIGNEQLIGFDFMDISKAGNEAAIEAYKRGDVVITNPFDLVQGGLGMAGRLPVFLEKNGTETFWGLVTVTMDFDQMIESFHFENLTDQYINYRLWYEGEEGEQVTLAKSVKEPENAVSFDFPIQNLNWHLDVAPRNGWQNHFQIAAVMLIILAVSLMLALLLMDKIRIRHVNEQLEQLAHLDGLTNCYSRHYVNTILLNRNTGCWNDPRARYSLAIVDIDCFKNINDTYGHEIGDRAILAVAQVLRDHSRQMNGDCVIRHGGDEFIILWNDVSRERFLAKLQEIVDSVREISFSEYPGMKLTISVGGVAYEKEDPITYYEMCGKADKKLYQAKENGRDQFVV